MLIAKTLEPFGKADFYEVLKVGSVGFDTRPDWLLVGKPIGARPRRQEIKWIHPSEVKLAWIRNYF